MNVSDSNVRNLEVLPSRPTAVPPAAIHEPAPASSARAGCPAPRRRAAGPAPIVFQLGLVLAHALATVLIASTALDRSPKPASGRLKGSSPFDGSLRPDEPPDAGAARPAPGAPSGDRSLRQGRQGDTVEAIAPDAAALRSRHVARRIDCGSS